LFKNKKHIFDFFIQKELKVHSL